MLKSTKPLCWLLIKIGISFVYSAHVWNKKNLRKPTYIFVNTICKFSIIVQTHESSLPPLEKKLGWELSSLIFQPVNFLCMTKLCCFKFRRACHTELPTAGIQQCSLHYQLISNPDWITYQHTAWFWSFCLPYLSTAICHLALPRVFIIWSITDLIWKRLLWFFLIFS